MHLHSLSFRAVGPFPGEHTIAFADLAAGGLFLLEGPTGAGKSTLIDMIVFALYGKVASKEATEERLRSAHADPATETYVDLVLETASGLFRVRRTPQYARPKQRGTGTTTQQATVKLWRLTSPDAPDHGELVSARLDEAAEELKRAVGLDRDQFVQTIVLPQGEFAGFLRAKPEDRRGLLQKVFGTAVYERVQERLERMRAEARREIEGADARIRQAVEGFVAAARLEDEPAGDVRALCAGSPVEGGALLGAVDGHVDRLVGVADAAAVVSAAAKERCSDRLTELDAARELRARLDRRAALRAERAGLESRTREIEDATERRDAARRAATVRDALEALDRAETGVRAAEEALAQVERAAPADLRLLVEADDAENADPDGVESATGAGAVTAAPGRPDDPAADRVVTGAERRLVQEKDRCTGLLAVLEHVAEVERSLPGRRAEITTLEASVADLEVRLVEQRDERGGRPAAREALEQQVADARTTAAGLGAAQAAVAVAEARLEAAVDVQTLTAEIELARAELARLSDAAQRAVATEARLRAARIAGIAGELAEGLTDGEACQVCGSTEHPAPAVRSADHVDAETVSEAEAVRTEAERRVSERSVACAALGQQLAQRQADAQGVGAEPAKQQLLEAERTVTAAHTAERAVTELNDALRRFDEATVALDQQAARTAETLARQVTTLTERREALAADETRVAGVLDGCESVAVRVTLLRARVTAAATWCEALVGLRTAVGARGQRRVELDSALVRAAFPDAASARAAHLSAAPLAALEEQVETFHRALTRVLHGLRAPEITTLAEDAVVDLDGAVTAHRAAEDEATSTAREAATAHDRAEAGARAAEQVTAALRGSEVARAAAAPVVRMADLAAASSADNAKQLTLATYVLARRFEDVVAAANGRLRIMSSGRFELVRSEEKEAVRTRRTGLAMKVVDHHTSTERDPRSLSGGETFYVSLCLALGLADVVTAEAGGTDLGTLFVDEGFGTLDAETLEVVLAELGRLRDGGRVVGVVSHVEALKQAIAERVEVRRLAGGGSTVTVRA